MGKEIRVVLDTKVWVSIFIKKTLGREFSKIFEKKDIKIYCSEPLLKEISKVLMYPKIIKLLDLARITPKGLIRIIAENSIMVKPEERVNVIKEDPEDNRVLECALVAKADFIVSGNRHLLKLEKFKNIGILTPRKFLELV